jgi:TPR repeat protein
MALKNKRVIIFSALIVLLSVAHELYAAFRGWDRFDTAIKNGDPGAETKLCSFYYKGHPLSPGDQYPQDYVKAMMWCRRAADQGYAEAQFDVGHMYWHGEGVPKDLVQGYMWMTLAAEQNPRVTDQTIPNLEKNLTLKQIAEGKRRAAEWKPEPTVKSDATLQQ